MLYPSCADVALPPVKIDYCSPDIDFGEVDSILFTTGISVFEDFFNGLATYKELSRWLEAIDNASPGDGVIRQLIGIGDKPAPERSEIQISGRRKIKTPAKHVVNFRVDETNLVNYEFLRRLDKTNGATVYFWFTSGKYLYGGFAPKDVPNTATSGQPSNQQLAWIRATLNADLVIPESRDEVKYFQVTASWEGEHPNAILSPFN